MLIQQSRIFHENDAYVEIMLQLTYRLMWSIGCSTEQRVRVARHQQVNCQLCTGCSGGLGILLGFWLPLLSTNQNAVSPTAFAARDMVGMYFVSREQ